MKKTSQRSLLFRQNVGRTEEEWAHFLDGYRQALSLRLASTSGRGGRGGDEGLARMRGGALSRWGTKSYLQFIRHALMVIPVRRLKMTLSWLWLAKPHVSAIMSMGD